MMLKDRIKHLRVLKGFTQKQLAELLNVTQQAVAKWEKGVSEPDAYTLALLSDYFDVTVDHLIGHEKKPAAQSDELTSHERDLLRCYRAASPDDRAIIDNIVSRYTHAAEANRLA